MDDERIAIREALRRCDQDALNEALIRAHTTGLTPAEVSAVARDELNAASPAVRVWWEGPCDRPHDPASLAREIGQAIVRAHFSR